MSTAARKKNVQKPAVVLCSRGLSFIKRLHYPVEWAMQNGIERVILLHSPEGKYSPAFALKIEKEARELFAATNAQLRHEKRKKLQFELLLKKGKLQTNIAELIAVEDIRIVFVGMKMLDYRLSEIKKLRTSFHFIADKRK